MGAVFSGGGAVVSYDDGVQAAASGTTGTQRNEFNAAIKSVTSATTVGAVFIYDTSQDSCEWRSKCKGLSWFDEAASATRSARSEFPAMALIVGDNVTTNNETLTIYDLDDPAMPVWMVFQAVGNLTTITSGAVAFQSIFALNGRVYVGFNDNEGLVEYNFADDDTRLGLATAYHVTSGRRIADRNAASSFATGGDGYVLVNATVNDVAATVLEGAEIGALGLPIPTVAVATAGGVSVIHPSGDVYDQTHQISTDVISNSVEWDDKGGLYWGSRASGAGNHYLLYWRNTLFADSSAFPSKAFTDIYYTTNLLGGTTPVSALAVLGNEHLAVGGTNGLSLIRHNDGNPDEGMVSHHTSTYATGYMVGDIRGAWLANNATDDKCVKGNDLSAVGTIDEDSADGGTGELQRYYGFTASDYLTRASDTDFDFGTGDFSIMFWVKLSSLGNINDLIARNDATAEAGDWFIRIQADNTLRFYRHTGSSWATVLDSTATVGTEWTQVVVLRRGGTYNWYLNGAANTSGVDTNTLTPSGGSAFTVGLYLGDTSASATEASLSLLRISATAPTPKQIADIYSAEKPLFAANAKCLLYPNTSSVVQDLAFDKSTNLLYVPTSSGTSIFRGLERVEEINRDTHYGLATSGSLDFVSASGGVSAGGRITAGVGANLPALDVRAELNEGDDKLPDDGKLHFSGVTTDATQTTIGNIVVGPNETVNVKATVHARNYNQADGNSYFADIVQEFRSDTAGTSAVQPAFSEPTYKLFDHTGLATGDVTLTINDTNDTVEIKVTGAAGYRFVWTATVEVQRISDKKYER